MRDIRASGTANETIDGIAKPCGQRESKHFSCHNLEKNVMQKQSQKEQQRLKMETITNMN